jgi:hypothetical protein
MRRCRPCLSGKGRRSAPSEVDRIPAPDENLPGRHDSPQCRGDTELYAVILAGGKRARLAPIWTKSNPRPGPRPGPCWDDYTAALGRCFHPADALRLTLRQEDPGGEPVRAAFTAWRRTTAGMWNRSARPTVATFRYKVLVKFRNCGGEGHPSESIEERPRITVDIFAGIQVIGPLVRQYLPKQGRLDRPSLSWRVINGRHRVPADRFPGSWHDMGAQENPRLAAREFKRSPELFIPAGASVLGPTTCPMGFRSP